VMRSGLCSGVLHRWASPQGEQVERGEELGEGDGGSFRAEDLAVSGGAQSCDSEGHGDAMVGAGVDGCAVEGLIAGDLETVGVLGEARSHGAEVFGDERDAVGLLDAEFLGVAEDEAVRGERSDGGEDGKLVDELRGEGAFDEEGSGSGGGGAVGWRGVDLDGADELAMALFDGEDFDLAAEGGDDVEQGGAGGFMPRESRTRLESGKRRAAQRKNAAEEMSPGTVASMAFSFCPPGMERRAGWLGTRA